MAHTPASLQTKLSHNAQLHYYVGSAPFHKAGIMLYNPKMKQTVIRRSFTQLESTDEKNPSLPVSISESISDDITQSALPTVPDVVHSATKRSSKQNNNNSLHAVPYLLRSRSIRHPSQSNNISSLLLPMLPTIVINLQSFRSLVLYLHLINSSHQKNRLYLLFLFAPSYMICPSLFQDLFLMVTVHCSFSYFYISYFY